ncbi:uncharacterized protein LOC110101889 [Dendrobium catenatum]|uniref:uncharacterized protein LOC110101889 n=1 Tax=Dendrobium catenatum TaxID=906689 RepID=UPI0009F2D54F|nr:uncharacterized protein LOC110101889 [Dendrobium catenatum]
MKFSFKITPSALIAVHWDHWCYNGNMDSFSDGHFVLLHTNPNTLIRDLIRDNCWSLPNEIPVNVKLAIQDIPIFTHSSSCLFWDNLKLSRFSDYINAFHSNMPFCPWYKLVWHKSHALRYSAFTWLALVGGLKTSDALLIRNIQIPNVCSLCHVFPESSSHLFFECSYSYEILISIMPVARQLLLRPSILQLLEWITNDPDTTQHTKKLYSIFSYCSIYYIWKERNSRRFANIFNSSSTTTLCIKKDVNLKICLCSGSNSVLLLLLVVALRLGLHLCACCADISTPGQ